MFVVYSLFCLFFFKQKTAYEMRISDWSSDVCSSDLHDPAPRGRQRGAVPGRAPAVPLAHPADPRRGPRGPHAAHGATGPRRMVRPAGDRRSEEHTSELQSLMRISYAVFCLKKKKK